MQTDLFDLTVAEPRARKRDAQTSHDAAARAEHFVASHEAKCFGALCDHGPQTYRAIAALTGMEPVAVARRLRSMEKRGLIRKTERVIDGCTVWERT